ncbi:Spy/CpxP family protein refolding chaperone [Shewanella psychrotolerans]|uniref:Spy/CpxP family protein refolding chaperone n=1 Tax=Shewanella psychrotolerans TaxID=2864206 RepID=UPI001C65CB4B|nr:Spy/CpxP family protein refolding chaperone [Shewanella psychrotolerans]QYK01639.1 Spy/CpxP family protein refolding chaperone [Shewanella psychrotolerans]
MNKFTLKSGLLAFVTTAALMAPMVYAGNGHYGTGEGRGDCFASRQDMRGDHRGYHDHMRKMFRGLNLTDQQRTDIKVLMQQHRDAMQDKRPSSDVRQAHQEQMLTLVTADSFNEADAIAFMEARQAQRQQGAIEMMKVQREIYQLLTPAQQAQFKENFAKRGIRKGDRP